MYRRESNGRRNMNKERLKGEDDRVVFRYKLRLGRNTRARVCLVCLMPPVNPLNVRVGHQVGWSLIVRASKRNLNG